MPSVLTLDKSLSILEFVVGATDGVGTRELAREFGLNVATVHNIAQTFVKRGYLRQDEESRRFHAGMMLQVLARNPGGRRAFAIAAQSVVRRLTNELNESVMVASIDADFRLYNIAFAASRQALRVHEPADMSTYAHCTAVGKVLLAHFDEDHLAAFLGDHELERYTDRTLVSPMAVREEIDRIARRGFAKTEDEFCEGVSAIAVPIRDPYGNVFAAIGASAPTVRMKKRETEKATLLALQGAALEIEGQFARKTEAAPKRATAVRVRKQRVAA